MTGYTMTDKNLILCDLDGTLTTRGEPLSQSTLETMTTLRRNGHVVAIATGRSPYSAWHLLTPEMPLDYLIFSTGVGIMDWKTQATIRAAQLDKKQVQEVIETLIDLKMDFMIQDPIPDNHSFAFKEIDPVLNEGTDFNRRVRIYGKFAREWKPSETFEEGASQLIAIIPPNQQRLQELTRRLHGLSVVRATSPLDHNSYWLEIFAPNTTKANAAQWLAEKLNISSTCALGNDFNDLDLLRWAQRQLVAKDAPQELLDEFPANAKDPHNALEEAAKAWSLI